jgi:glyoxalase/bleomycin resistance protein/dioxygenase superfamily protein
VSYVALATNYFDELVSFYVDLVGFARTASWDRPNARGARLSMRDLRLELLDNTRLRTPFPLGEVGGRLHLVIETDDLDADRTAVRAETSEIRPTTWGCRPFELHDPDGIRLTFLQWDNQ